MALIQWFEIKSLIVDWFTIKCTKGSAFVYLWAFSKIEQNSAGFQGIQFVEWPLILEQNNKCHLMRSSVLDKVALTNRIMFHIYDVSC